MEDQHNPEFVGDEKKFKYLAIHGYEKFQKDKYGKLADGSRLWIKSACRKNHDPDFSALSMLQRATLDGMRDETGLHGKWLPNDPMKVVRSLEVGRKERHSVSRAVRELVVRRLLYLSNESLGSLEEVEEVDKKEKKQRPTLPEKTEPKTQSAASAPAPLKRVQGIVPIKVRALLDWDEDVGDISADQIRRAIRWKWKQPDNTWIRTKCSPGWVRKNAQKLVDDVPPSEFVPKYESKPDPNCTKCSGSGNFIEEDGLYQSSVTCFCVQQVEVG